MNSSQPTCMVCGVVFSDDGVQREHFKSEWHRYNVRRKAAEYDPITYEKWQKRMEENEQKMKVLSGDIKPETGYCYSCRKNFTTKKAYDNHLNSKKHKQTEEKFQKKAKKDEIMNNRLNRKPAEKEDEPMNEEDGDEDWSDMSDDDDNDDDLVFDAGEMAIRTNECLFCPHASRDLEKNLLHMTEKHSFFLNDPEFICDLEGLVEYLGEKVGKGFMCLWCDRKSKLFHSLDSVQRHMVDKGHCRINYDGVRLVEYCKFYDYSASYPTATVGGGENEDDEDEEADENIIDDSGYELTLPSGAKIGHRSLMKYYRQSVNPDRQLVFRKPTNSLLSKYKALGWTGLTGAEAKKKAKDLKVIQKFQQKHYMKLGVRANKLQTHFVDPTGHIG